MNADIYPDSGSRLPLLKRGDLDELGKRLYDSLVNRKGSTSVAGLRGPGGLNLYSPPAAEHIIGLNQYLRHGSEISAELREIAILTTAREMDNQFEWSAHEPVAAREGIRQEVIDVIKHRASTQGLDEAHAVIIELGRQVFEKKKVEAALFARGRELFGDRLLVELIMLMGNYAAIAVLLTACDMQLAEGEAALLPARQA